MKLGERVLARVIDIVEECDFNDSIREEIFNLVKPFLEKGKTEKIDLMTICKLEIITGKKILTVPSKQEWRKIKLERLNQICNEKKF